MKSVLLFYVHFLTLAETENKVNFLENRISPKFPFFVSLQVLLAPNKIRKFCNGSILSTNFVLTAAHCFDNLNVQLRPKIFINSEEIGDFYQSKLAKFYVIHPNYVPHEFSKYDIALVKLESNINFTKSVKNIEIIHDLNRNSQADIFAVGLKWCNRHSNKSETNLKSTQLKIEGAESCSRYFKDGGKLISLTGSHICAFSMDTSVNPYMGDSGGPLVVKVGLYFKIVGVLSYGPEICGAGPVVYSDLTFYGHRRFIDYVMETF